MRVEQRAQVGGLVGQQAAHFAASRRERRSGRASPSSSSRSLVQARRAWRSPRRSSASSSSARDAQIERRPDPHVQFVYDVRSTYGASRLRRSSSGKREVRFVGILAAGERSRSADRAARRARSRAAQTSVVRKSPRRRQKTQLREHAQQSGVIFGHLLEVRHRPIARRRIAEETALDVIVHAAARHRRASFARPSRSSRCVAGRAPSREQQIEQRPAAEISARRRSRRTPRRSRRAIVRDHARRAIASIEFVGLACAVRDAGAARSSAARSAISSLCSA